MHKKHSIDLDSITFSEDSENQATEDDNEEKQRLEGRMTEAKSIASPT
jgi:hypothetical protein